SCLSIIPTSSLSSLFPYTTLFRSSFGNPCFRSAGNHHFSLTPPDVVQRIHNSGVRGSTGGNGGVVNAHQPVFHGNESRCHIDDELRHKKRIETGRIIIIGIIFNLFFKGEHTALTT